MLFVTLFFFLHYSTCCLFIFSCVILPIGHFLPFSCIVLDISLPLLILVLLLVPSSSFHVGPIIGHPFPFLMLALLLVTFFLFFYFPYFSLCCHSFLRFRVESWNAWIKKSLPKKVVYPMEISLEANYYGSASISSVTYIIVARKKLSSMNVIVSWELLAKNWDFWKEKQWDSTT